VQRRGRLRSDSGVAPPGVGDRHAQMHATHPIAGGEVPEHGPRLHECINAWHKLRRAGILLLPQRTRDQSVEVVRDPKRVGPVGERIQVVGSGKRLRPRA